MSTAHRTADTLGERLRRLRIERGYSLRELGKEVGTSHRMIAYYEIQGGNPPADVVVKLAKALSVSADSLLGLKNANRAAAAHPENVRLLRKLRQVEKLPLKDRRSVLQFIEALVERQALKETHG